VPRPAQGISLPAGTFIEFTGAAAATQASAPATAHRRATVPGTFKVLVYER
jgi:hypothetical protein